MNKLRVATIVFGAITLFGLVGPFMFSGSSGSPTSEAYRGLFFVIIGWLFVAPLAGLVALLLGVALSFRALRAPEATSATRFRVIAWWACLFAVATLLWLLIQSGSLGGTPIAGIGAAFAVVTGVALVGVWIASYWTPRKGDGAPTSRSTPTRRTRIALISLGAAGVLAAGFFAYKLSLLSEYNRTADYAVRAETQLQEWQQEAELNLASACFMLPDARQAVEQASLLESARPPALPAELADRLHRRTAEAAEGFTTFDPSVCEQAAARVEAAVAANGHTLAGIDWRDNFAQRELAERLPPMARPEPDTPSLWFISAADVRHITERNSVANDRFIEVRDGEAEIGHAAERIVRAPLSLIGGDLRSAATEGAEAVIREAGTEGSPAAAALREAAAASLADDAPHPEQAQAYIEYLRQAMAMLGG